MWNTVRSAQLAPTSARRCLLALSLVAGGSLPSGNGQSAVSPRFEDFPVSNVYRGVVKPPYFGNRDHYQGADLRCFGGDPTDYANKEVNFAGHFVISTCTCGSECHYLFMWDAISGRFYQRIRPGAINVGPYARRGVQPPGIVYQGEQYRPNSSLLIEEGCVEDTCDCATRYFRWTGNQFKLILRQPVRMPETCLKKR